MFRPITDDDIDLVEPILLPEGKTFGEEARAVIKCMDTVDVNACPGSGKTTLMLAKLLILSGQIPLPENKGICVLTHTNVAIDEIKERLGQPDHSIFKYPNHFGTIQSFVNKFLGSPGYESMYPGKRPVAIDQETYVKSIERRYNRWNGAGKTWVSRQTPSPLGLLQSFRFKNDFTQLTRENGSAIFQTATDAYPQIFTFRKNLLKDGILSFHDAYLFAEYYLNKFPQVISLLRKRFPLLIIDEMQDTDAHQLSVLDKVFVTGETIIQRIGDLNQSIFTKIDHHTLWNIGGNQLPLTGSNRFSQAIARQIDKISITPRNMNGNQAVNDIQPCILLYQQANIEHVIPLFGNKIIEHGISAISSKPCKAVGHVRVTDAEEGQIKNCIRSYYPSFQVFKRSIRTDFSNLSEYLVKESDEIILIKGTGFYLDRMLQVFLKILSIADIRIYDRPYNKTLLRSALKRNRPVYDEFSLRMIGWIKQILNNQLATAEVRDYCLNTFMPQFGVAASAEINAFLNDQNPVAPILADQQLPTNILNHTYSGSENEHNNKTVDIHINTIHSVKGETHSATLYMETFYHADDIKRILAWYKIGDGVAVPVTGARKIGDIKLAYVAMSRPQHFLCVAISNTGITDQDIQELQNVGWFVDQTLC